EGLVAVGAFVPVAPGGLGIDVTRVREGRQHGEGTAREGVGQAVLLRVAEAEDGLVLAAEGMEAAREAQVEDVAAGPGLATVGPADEAGVVAVEVAGGRVGIEQPRVLASLGMVVGELGFPFG